MGVYNNNNGVLTPIANETQFIAPVNEYVTKPELEAIIPNDTSAENKLVTENEVTKAYDTMPTASVDLVGTIIQYVGTTTANYTNGYFYKCVSDGAITPTYSWIEVISGAPPTITADATVDNTTGTPAVNVTKTGTDAAPEFTFAFSGLKGAKGDKGDTYDDTEIRAEIDDVWKAQGKLGAKNLVSTPYADKDVTTRNGINYTLHSDGSITISGTATGYSYYIINEDVLRKLGIGNYILNLNQSSVLPSDCGVIVIDRTANKQIMKIWLDYSEWEAEFTQELVSHDSDLRIMVNQGVVIDPPITIYPMIRLADDQDSTYHPYAMTNKEITDKLMNSGNSYEDIVCWGDSLTAMGGWTQKLQELSGIPVYNGGTGGEDSKCIMARQGGDVMIVDGITIPATTTAVTIASRATDAGISTELGNKVTPLFQASAHVNPVTVGDITGTLAWTGSSGADQNGTWTFTRATAGEEIVIDRPTAIRTNFDNVHNGKNELMIIYMGANGGWTDVANLIHQHKLMIDHFKGKEYVVLGLSTGTAASSADYEAAMKEAFGRRFISLREYLAHPIYENGEIVSCYGLADQGLTPTADDLEKIAIGQVPASCLADSVHYTVGTREVIGNMLYRKLKELNIL